MSKDEVPEKHFKVIAIIALVAIIGIVVSMILTYTMHMIARAEDLGWNLSYITLPASQAQAVGGGIVPAAALMTLAIVGMNIHEKNEKIPLIFGIILAVALTVLIIVPLVSGVDTIIQGFEPINSPLLEWFIAIGVLSIALTPLCIVGLLQALKIVKYGQGLV